MSEAWLNNANASTPMNESIRYYHFMQGLYVHPLVTTSCVEVWGMAFMLKPLIALTAGEYKDSVPLLYSLSCSPYTTKQKPQIGSSH